MQTVFFSGVTFEQLQESIKGIVRNEIESAISQTLQFQDPEPDQSLITRKDAASILGVSLPTLNEWTKTGLIRAKRIGTRIRYLRSDVYNALKDVDTLKYRRG